MKYDVLVLATLLLCSVAELRVSRGRGHKVPSAGLPQSHRNLQECDVIGWAELCESNRTFTAGSCFRLEPSAVPSCHLQGPTLGAVQLRSAEVVTLKTLGELRISGQFEMISLRFVAKTLSFEDAEVNAWHEVPLDPGEFDNGGAFHAASGSFTLTRSNLTVRGTGAVNGGGFAVDGDLSLQDSQVFIADVSAQNQGAGFYVGGKAKISDNSLVSIQNAKCWKQGGGLVVGGKLQVSNRSVVSLENVTARINGGGFYAFREVVISDHSTLNITNSLAESGIGGGFWADKSFTVTSSTLAIWSASSGYHGGGFYVNGKIVISSSTVCIQNVRAKQVGGGFVVRDKVIITDMSNVSVSNTAGSYGGGFFTLGEVVIADMSNLSVSNASAPEQGGGGGGFQVNGRLQVSNRSMVSLENVTAGVNGGGFMALGEVVIADMSNVYIFNASALKQGGGFQVEGRLQVNNRSTVTLENVTAGVHGGGFLAGGEVVIADRSAFNITNSRAESGNGGGFWADKSLTVSNSSTLMVCNTTTSGGNGGGFMAGGKVVINSSTLRIEHASATQHGAGFAAQDTVVIADMSNMSVSNARALAQAGGFQVDGRLQVSNRSVVSLENVSAGIHGGGFNAHAEVVIADRSALHITNSRAESGTGGGFWAKKSLRVSTNSTLMVCNTTSGGYGGGFFAVGVVIADRSTLNITNSRAESGDGGGFGTGNDITVTSSTLVIRSASSGNHGGGFYVKGKFVMSSSTAHIQNVTAMQTGGGFATTHHVELVNGSAVILADAHAGADGGGFWLNGLTLHRSWVFINKSSANRSGTGGLANGHVLLASESKLVVHSAEGPKNSSVLAASCIQLRERSNIMFKDVIGGHGMDLRNTGCKGGGFCHSTFQVASDATVNASGRLTSGLLSVAACVSEKIRLAGIHLQDWSSPLLSTSGARPPGHVVVDQVRIDYDSPVNNLPVLAVKDFTVDSLMASCADCAHGLTFDAEEGRLLALSPEDLQCSKTARVSNGSTTRCECGSYQIPRADFRDQQMVPIESIFQTCRFCEPHSHFQDGTCRKCDLFSAWSDGGRDVCHTWPREKQELLLLFLGTALVVLMIFIVFEILKAPLTITEAKSTMAQVAEGKRSFTLSVQGPIVDLHKRLSGLLHRRISYYAHGTDLQWLDSDRNSKTPFTVSTVARRKLMIESLGVPFDCAACKGSLHPTNIHFPFMAAVAFVVLAVMLPIAIQIAVISGNGLEHIIATTVFALLPMAVAAALFHVPVALFLRWLYSRTPFREALEQYEKRIQCTPQTGPDASHPYNQGLLALTLLDLWQHFEGFILESNMHFVVANIVRLLTKSKQVSFVSLWGGRQVDYFVSHSWGTGFRHFVRSIHSHALSKEGPTAWTDAAYWICSFANNQWDIGAELGSDPMTSAFARVLTRGPKEVAMVLDKEVQPLTRVWCLFEFLLASRQQVNLVFVTDAGVVGDDGCTSFDIALEVGKKIKSLQVATCQASSEEDKKNIFDYIIGELGSLEQMDKQIRSLIRGMLLQNLANVGRATGDLVQELG